MRDLYFEDFAVGDRFESRGKTITEAEILEFALIYDPQPFHMDVEAAKAGPYGGLIASGFQTLALSFRLFFQEGILAAAGMGSPGMDEVRWMKPVRPGDTIRCLMEVLEVRPSASRPDRGTARVRYSTLNQAGETVMTVVVIQILRRRPAAG